MMAPSSLALVCGLSLGVGLWLLVSLAPALGRPRLVSRVAPYVMDVSAGAREILDEQRARDGVSFIPQLLEPLTRRLRGVLDGMLGGNQVVARRLRQSGSSLTVEAFRSRQLMWAAASAACGIAIAVALGASQPVTPGTLAAIVILLAASGFLLRDRLLQHAAKARLARMAKEVPAVLEFLTLSLSAGEGILDALRRIARISRGELAKELATVVNDVATGLPLAPSLTELAGALEISSFTRAVEQICGALERGTPLAEVLRAQTQDARDDAGRELLEIAGKKEVAMLVPLVFLILPMTIVIAIFPGVVVLQLGS